MADISASKPLLQVFYSSNCAPCRLELPVLADVAAGRTVDLSIVVFGDREKAFAELRGASTRLAGLATAIPENEERQTLRAAGNADGILPYARILSASGLACDSWRGGLTPRVIARMLERCASAS